MLFLSFFFVLFLGISAELEPRKTFPEESDCNIFHAIGFAICETATNIENSIFQEPSEVEKRAYNTTNPQLLECERHKDCLFAYPCARTEKKEISMRACELYRYVDEKMDACLNKIKSSMSIHEWNGETFVGPVGYFREKFDFTESWWSGIVYHPLICKKLREHLKNFRGLISKHCDNEIWINYYHLVQVANTNQEFCSLGDLDG